MKKHLRRREQCCALLFCFVGFLTFYGRNCQAGEAAQLSTFCNPLNLPYRFSLESPSRREAADPTIVRWNNEYWLFASKSGGYWHSADFAHWTFVVPSGLPVENYAPDVEVINGRMYFTASKWHGRWHCAARIWAGVDPPRFAPSIFRNAFAFGPASAQPNIKQGGGS
jgi:xylan 1,4-beta-xylosidase